MSVPHTARNFHSFCHSVKAASTMLSLYSRRPYMSPTETTPNRTRATVRAIPCATRSAVMFGPNNRIHTKIADAFASR